MFSFQSSCGTHMPDKVKLLLFPGFPSWPGKTANRPVDLFNRVPKEPSSSTRQTPQSAGCRFPHQKAAGNNPHCSLGDTRLGHTRTDAAEQERQGDCAGEQEPLNCTYFTSEQPQIQTSSKIAFFCLHLPLRSCAVALLTQPCGTTSS